MRRIARVVVGLLVALSLVVPLTACNSGGGSYSGGSGASSGYSNGGPPAGYSKDGYYTSPPPGANPSPQSPGPNTQWHWVDGYTRSDGTYVDGYWRRTK